MRGPFLRKDQTILRVTGIKQWLCDGMTRRTVLKIGALGMGGLSLTGLLRPERLTDLEVTGVRVVEELLT